MSRDPFKAKGDEHFALREENQRLRALLNRQKAALIVVERTVDQTFGCWGWTHAEDWERANVQDALGPFLHKIRDKARAALKEDS